MVNESEIIVTVNGDCWNEQTNTYEDPGYIYESWLISTGFTPDYMVG